MLKIYPVCFGDTDIIPMTRPVAILLINKAEGVLKVKNQCEEIVAGRVFLLRADQQVQVLGEMLIGYIVEFKQALLDSFLVLNVPQRNTGLYSLDAILPYTDHAVDVSWFLKGFLGKLMDEVERRTSIAINYLFLLLMIVNPKVKVISMWHHAEEHIIDKLRLLINEHFKSHRRPRFYAAHLGISKAKLNVLTHAFSGNRFYDLLNERVFAEANLMLLTDIPIKEIGYELGFNTPSHFDLSYRRYMKMSPGKYRKLNS